jgi:hypothetical protein
MSEKTMNREVRLKRVDGSQHDLFYIKDLTQIVLDYLQYKQAIEIWDSWLLKCEKPERPMLSKSAVSKFDWIDQWYIRRGTVIGNKLVKATEGAFKNGSQIYAQCGYCKWWKEVQMVERSAEVEDYEIEVVCYVHSRVNKLGVRQNFASFCGDLDCARAIARLKLDETRTAIGRWSIKTVLHNTTAVVENRAEVLVD